MMEEILEPVRVGAVFGNGSVSPRWFVWRERRYPVDRVSYAWHDRNGEELICRFSVVAGPDLYELAFYTKKLNWVLNKVYVEG